MDKDFLKNVCTFFSFDIKTLKLQTDDMLLLMLDANESLRHDNAGIAQLTATLRLSDLFVRHHQSECNIATQSRGSERIDFMFGSPNLLPHIAQCGYLSFNQEIESDHRAMFIDLKNSIIDSKIKLCEPRYSVQITTNDKI